MFLAGDACHSSLYDHFGTGFTLIALHGARSEAIDQARQQARESGVRALYPSRFTLIRPDQHVAWRGNAWPALDAKLFERVCGRTAWAPHSVSP